MTKRTFEHTFGMWLLGGWIVFALVAAVHVWQESLREDGAVIWSCHTMGDHDCAPGQPLIKIDLRKLGDDW